MKDEPLVTICMAAYNAEKFIEKSIASVLAQEYQNWELICVDDGSVDDTRTIIQRHASSDRRIKLITQSNQGAALARRAAMVASSGDFIVALDSDDWYDNYTLSTLISDSKKSGADIVMADMMVRDRATGEWTSFSNSRGMSYGALITGSEGFEMTFPWIVNGQFFMRKSIALTSISAEEYFPSYNNDEYLTRVFLKNSESLYFSKARYYYFQHPISTSSSIKPYRLDFIETNNKLLQLAFRMNLSAQTQARVLRQIAGGISSYASFLGYHVVNRDINYNELCYHLRRAWDSMLKYRNARNYILSKDPTVNLRAARISTMLLKFSYWFLREFLAKVGFVRPC